MRSFPTTQVLAYYIPVQQMGPRHLAAALGALLIAPAAAQQQPPTTLGCDSPDELLLSLKFLQRVCAQEGAAFADDGWLIPSAIATPGCASAARTVASDCGGVLGGSSFYASWQRALGDAIASASDLPTVDDAYHMTDPSLHGTRAMGRWISMCHGTLDDGLEEYSMPNGVTKAVLIDVPPSRGNARVQFTELTLDKRDSMRFYSDESRDHELVSQRLGEGDALPAGPITSTGSTLVVFLVYNGGRTSFSATISCACEDDAEFVDAESDGCQAYAPTGAKHGLCADPITADREARSACPLACGVCEPGPCAASQCENGGTCVEIDESAAAPDGGGGKHRRQLQDGDGYGTGGSCTVSELNARTDAVNHECCDEPTEDCSAGAPASCNSGCAAVLIPYVTECADLLTDPTIMDLLQSTRLLCDSSTVPPATSISTRGYRCSCATGWMGEDCVIEAPPPPPASLWHWSRSYSGITITEQNAVATMTSNNGCCYGAVVSTPFFPGSADSYVEFTLTGDAAQSVMVGIARSDFDPTVPVTNGGYHYGAYGTAAGWMMEAASGAFYHDYVHAQAATTWTRVTGPWTNPDEPWGPTTLEAAPATPAAQPGDTIGMWLHAGSLTVYLNGELVGVMCQGLVGNLVWAADLGDNAGGPLPEGVRIASGDPPHTCCSTRCYPCGSGTACDFCDGSCNSPGPAHCDQTHPEWANGCDRSC